jgi:hypothetical protein
MDQLALLVVGRDSPASLITRISAWGMALPIEVGWLSISAGSRIGRAERLGQAVHREQPRLREQAAQPAHQIHRQRPAAVGQPAQAARRVSSRPVELGQLHPQRRHRGQRGDAMALTAFTTSRGVR